MTAPASKRVLFFFPYHPLPPRHGAHRRCLEMLAALRSLGHIVTFASSRETTDDSWADEGTSLIREGLAARVVLHQYSLPERLLWSSLRRASRISARAGGPAMNDETPPFLGPWFRRTLASVAPDVVFMNYGKWGGLVPDSARTGLTTILDSHDLVSLNRAMQRAVQAAMGYTGQPIVVRAHEASDDLLDLQFFRRHPCSADAAEFRAFDRYQHTMAISAQEAGLIRAACHRTTTHFVPMTQRVAALENSYAGPALCPVGPNFFNVQGLLFFARRVLPRVLQHAPDFTLDVTGTLAYNVSMEMPPGMHFAGYADDFRSVLAEAAFLVCPVFGGTGQQVKIVEAMAHGLAVVALRDAAERSPLEHGISGLVADTAEEFAEHVLTLWKDRALCRALGQAARRVVTEQLSEGRLMDALTPMLRAAT